MNIWFKFVILYLIPVLSVAGVMGLYAISYGKYSESTFNTFAGSLLVVAFIISCFLTFNIIEQCLAQKEMMNNFSFYSQMFLSGLAWFIELALLLGGIYITYSQTPV